MKYKDDAVAAAIQIVKDEVSAYENPFFYVTEDISFNMRNLIRQCRKNYHGIFDNPIDKVSGRQKIHPKLTQVFVEGVLKNIDMDVKHFTYRSKNGRKGIKTAELLRFLSSDYFSKTYFGETLDELERTACIDGTAILKTYTKKVNGVEKLVTTPVDRLNFYINPTARSIADAPRVTERAVHSVTAVQSMKGWHNTDKVEGKSNLDQNPTEGATVNNTSKDVDVFETWGQVPKWIVDNNPDAEDKDTEVEAHIVVSGIKSKQPILHLIEENKKKDSQGNPIRPYEELRYRKVQGRWDGMGVAEQIWTLEMWNSLVVNARINRNTLAQLGIFTVKKSGGVATSQLARMASSGIIRVNDHDDIENFPIQEAGVSSYKDEDVINNIAEKLTSAFEVAMGDALPASATATGVAVSDKNAGKAFTLVREQIGFFGQRWMNRHLAPYLATQVKKGDIIRFSGEEDGFDEQKSRAVAYLVDQAMERLFEQGQYPTELAIERAVANAEERIKRDGALFYDITSKIITDGIDAHVQITNEDLNVGVMLNNMVTLLQADPEARVYYRDMIADLMGIPRPPKQFPQPQQPQQAIPGNVAPQQTQPNQVDELTDATTLAA